MDMSRLSEGEILLQKKGCFEINRFLIINNPFLVMSILSIVLVVDAREVGDRIIYHGYCDQFDAVNEGDRAPIYMVRILDAGRGDIVFLKEDNVRLREVMDETSFLRSYYQEGRERIDRCSGMQDVGLRETRDRVGFVTSLLHQSVLSHSQTAGIISA